MEIHRSESPDSARIRPKKFGLEVLHSEISTAESHHGAITPLPITESPHDIKEEAGNSTFMAKLLKNASEYFTQCCSTCRKPESEDATTKGKTVDQPIPMEGMTSVHTAENMSGHGITEVDKDTSTIEMKNEKESANDRSLILPQIVLDSDGAVSQTSEHKDHKASNSEKVQLPLGHTLPSTELPTYPQDLLSPHDRPPCPISPSRKVTYLRYEVGDTSFTSITPRLPEKKVPTEAEENCSLEAQGFRIGRDVEDVDQGVIVRAGYPTGDFNCHGWVFLEGEAWLDDDKSIIDNLIQIGNFTSIDISNTQPGDIALYRNLSTGKVTHSASVHEIRDDNKLVFVSKWAEGSLFYHYSDDVPKSYYNDEVMIEIYRAPEGWTCPSPTNKIPMIRRSTSEDVIARLRLDP